jgi:hypothetical protein
MPITQPFLPLKRRTLALSLLAAIAAGAVLAEPGTVLKSTQLRSAPLGSADVVAELKAQQAVEITARQGAWAGVTTGEGQQGWARILNLRTASGQASVASANQLASVFRTGSSGTSVSTGVKGLSAEQLRSASPDFGEVSELDTYAANAGDARQFAGAGQLQEQRVDYLESPQSGRRQR